MAKKSNRVTIPRTYKSGPKSHKTTAVYITDAEIGLLRALDIHNSGIGKENHYGPGGLLNMNGWGEFDSGDPHEGEAEGAAVAAANAAAAAAAAAAANAALDAGNYGTMATEELDEIGRASCRERV